MIGTSFGRYRVLEPLGEGGMGRVYLAEDPSLGRRLAIKVLPPDFSRDPERRERLLHEARAASALNHPNILTIHDLGESDGALYVAMELVEGCTLREWDRMEKRAPADVLRLMRQALGALGVAHAAGLVHRDLKPENIMVRSDGLLKILDFGLARSVSSGAANRTATMPGTILGTAPYMSPEQVLGQRAGPASDLFSMGTILYELLAGRHPFAADTAIETMHRILHESPEPPSRVNRQLTADFDFVLAKALSKDPKRRHGSAHELDVDLETLECGCGPAVSAASGPGAGPRALAVLPFKNIGGDPDLGYLGVGLADAVITRLSDSPDLIVRATSSVAPYQNQPVDPRRVGAELEVAAVLDASFQRAGGRFRATARLVETLTGRSLWAGKVDVRFEDVFEVQDQVAQGIAEALMARLSKTASEERTGSDFAPAPEAYDLLLRAQEALRGGTGAAFRRAIELLERAVAIEPRYGQAWAILGQMYHGMTDGGFDPDPVWYQKAEKALAQARSLDPTNGLALFGTAALDLTRGAKREAYAGLIRALQHRPNEPLIYHYFAYLFRLCDMFEETHLAEGKSREIDPTSPWSQFAPVRVYLLQGAIDRAREALELASARFPTSPRTVTSELPILRAEQRYDAIVARLDSNPLLRGDDSGFVSFDIGFALIQLGQLERARPFVDRCERGAAVDMDDAAWSASLRAHLGDPDGAFRHLERAAALGNDCLTLYSDAVLYGPLHGDRRWEPFLEGVRSRVVQWRREFRWPPA